MTAPNNPMWSPENAPFWQAAAKSELIFKRCADCGKPHYYPRPHCPHCASAATEWQTSAGRGTIYSFSIVRRAEQPYALAYVTLDEGFTMLTRIVGSNFHELRIGLPVSAVFEVCGDGRTIALFTPLPHS